ncbi:uncharacterized protein PFB0145c-like [Notolabrus celidotus]|uniref:uncharacterized protein PFB0145c-like n=1 Tax=Notolabrus celidotus TaxID=1203425 RepID=UPI00148F53DC|nr:uncharacterized protein PFB0145c-like [Notolabrus celidotus]
MPKQTQKMAKAGKGRSKCQEDPIDFSKLPKDLKTPDEVWNAERGNTRKNNRSSRFQEEREMELAEQKSQDQEDLKKPLNPTADKTPAEEAEFMETIKSLSKRLLLKEYLQLRKDFVTTEDKLKKKLQKERTKSELLQEELEKKKASNTDVQESAEVPAQQQQAVLLNPETEEKLKSLEDRVLNDQSVISNLMAERDTLTQEMAEINILKEEAIKKQEDLLEKNEELKHELSLKTCLDQENEELKHELSLKKCLAQENEELKEKVKTSQEEFNAELQLAKQNHILLQQHYQALRVAYQKLGEAYQTQVVTVRNQAVNLQNQLKTQVQSNANRKREDQWLIRKLKTDLKALRGKTSATIISQKKYFLKIIEGLSNQLNSLREIREKYDDLKEEYNIRQEEFNAELQPEKQKNLLLQEDHESLRESYIELSKNYEAVIITLQQWAELVTQQGLAIQVQEEPEDSEINSTETAMTLTPQEEPEALTPVIETETPATETATPTTETETPATETETPVSETATPATETETPATDTATPATETATPATETETPATETETPVSETATPATETETPVSETATPATETETPVNETATPATETETPVSETATPATETATPAKPFWKMVRHFLGFRKPKSWKKKELEPTSSPHSHGPP